MGADNHGTILEAATSDPTLSTILSTLASVVGHNDNHTSNNHTLSDDGPHLDHHGHDTHGPSVILFIFASCAAGALVRTTMKRLPVPYTVVLMMLGCLIGIISNHVPIVREYTTIADVDPHLILHVFLPVLVFESAFAMETYTFIKTIWTVVILALPGLSVAALLTGVFAMNVFSYNWGWSVALMFGTVLSATDPVAVVALLKDLGASKQLATTMEGESLLNDGAAIVFFNVLKEIAGSQSTTVDPGYVIKSFVQVALGGPAFGFLMGKITTFWLVNIFNDALTEITITLAATYITFYVGEAIMKVSGVLAVVVLGLVLSAERTSISPEVEKFLHRFWEMLAYLCNTLIFMVVGVVITQRAVQGMSGSDWFYMVALYCAINIIRGVTIALFSPLLMRIGYGLSWQNGAVMTWGGLRGAVGLTLALLVAQDSSVNQLVVGNKILFHTAGIVLLTLVLNATSIRHLLKVLGMSDISGPKRMAMATAVRTLKDWAGVSLNILRTDRFLADADWDVVKKFTDIEDPYHTLDEEAQLNSLSDTYDRFSKCPTCDTEVPNEPTKKEMQEMRNEARMRVLKAEKTSYWKQFEHGMLSREAVRKLVEAAEVATDKEDAFIDLTEVKKTWQIRGLYAHLKKRLETIKYSTKDTKTPVSKIKGLKVLYKICSSDIFEGIMSALIVLNMIPIIWEVVLDNQAEPMHPYLETVVFPAVNYVFISIYVLEAGLKILAFNKWYFFDHWNQFDLVIIIMSIVDLILDLTVLNNAEIMDFISPSILRLVKIFRLLRLLRSLKLVKGLIPQVIGWLNGRISIQLRFGYDVGMGYVMGEEEVAKLVDHMVDNKRIADEMKTVLEDGRLQIIRALGILAREHPGIAVSVKTQQAARRILNNVRDKIFELRGEGVLDETEAGKLNVMVEVRMKRLLKIPPLIPPPPPDHVVSNLTWVANDVDLIAYIKHHAELISLGPGETIMKEGDPTGGIYIVVSGLIKVQRTVQVDKCLNYSQRGSSITNMHHDKGQFEKVQEKFCDYLTTGNVLGEMAVLTGEQRKATVICETAVQLYFVSLEAMRVALDLYREEPSLEHRLWRVCALRLSVSILMSQPSFYGWTQDKVRLHLEQCVVVDLSNCLDFEVDPSAMSDLCLINGTVVSNTTRDIYKGPCAIHIAQEKLIPKHDNSQKPILLFVPRESGIHERRGSATGFRRGSVIDPGSHFCLRHASKHRTELLARISDMSVSSSGSATSSHINLKKSKQGRISETGSEEEMIGHRKPNGLPPLRRPPPATSDGNKQINETTPIENFPKK